MMRRAALALLALLALLCGPQPSSAADAAAAPAAAAPVFYPPDGQHVAMYVLAAVAMLVAASGGVGGGPILVPLYLLLGGFSNTAAVALSNASIFAAAIANILVVVPRRRHPARDRPLVAWDLIMLLQPPTALGAMWGAYINKVTPAWVAQPLLALLLAALATEASVERGTRQQVVPGVGSAAAAADEDARKQGAARPASALVTAWADGASDGSSPPGGPRSGGPRASGGGAEGPPPPPPSAAESKLAYAPPRQRPEFSCDPPDLGGGSVAGVPIAAAPAAPGGGAAPPRPAPEVAQARLSAELERVLWSEARQLPPWPASGLLVMCGALLLASLLSKRFECAGWRFWVVQAAAVPVLAGLSAVARWDVLRKARVKEAAQVDWEGDIRWTQRNTALTPLLTAVAGVIAGVFGLGGGIVFTPLMLELGTHPQMGDLPWDFAGALMATAFVSTLVGQLIIDRAVRASGRGSLVVLVLAAFFAAATLLAGYAAARSVAAFARDPQGAGAVPGIC
ncbi:MAG: hypothetical protein J3K34DRAFT_515807 [Monoraphidium minutum]|nr:MAG: hypothetical protein J3K34DRAFT_515807 [Monoraphidium minutum]